jgi:hypothetical protein
MIPVFCVAYFRPAFNIRRLEVTPDFRDVLYGAIGLHGKN